MLHAGSFATCLEVIDRQAKPYLPADLLQNASTGLV